MKTLIATLALVAATSATAADTLETWAEQNGYFAVAQCLRAQDEVKATSCVSDLMTNGYFEAAFAEQEKENATESL